MSIKNFINEKITQQQQQQHRPHHNSKLQTIYWDVDDVIIDSSSAVINIINNKYLIPRGLPPKTVSDLKDWNFKSIYKQITPQEIEQIFESEEFWNTVQLKKGFQDILNSKAFNHYNHVFVTKGSQVNLLHKKIWLSEHMPNHYKRFKFEGLTLEQDKSTINMSGGIQIDDNFKHIKNTNAHLKIVLQNDLETDYNNAYYLDDLNGDDSANLYYINTLSELLEILQFNTLERL